MWGSGPYHISACGIGEVYPQNGYSRAHRPMFFAHVNEFPSSCPLITVLLYRRPGTCSFRHASYNPVRKSTGLNDICSKPSVFWLPCARCHFSVVQPSLASASSSLPHHRPCSYQRKPCGQRSSTWYGRTVHVYGYEGAQGQRPLWPLERKWLPPKARRP